ncbi:MAG: class I SAM-dependent methyltransferase [Planctomycetaceae bacterium]|nr:class I SAM-dependent methyltransferase [Planctomycetaceae bacterium]
MSSLVRWIDRTFYSDFESKWDEKLLRDCILEVLTPESRLLDLGAGRGVLPQTNYKDRCAFVAGVDPDPAVLKNPHLNEAKVQEAPDYLIPYPDESFDVVVSNSVIEHIRDPNAFFAEVNRVLSPGGLFVAKTPNRVHYMPTVARCTPHWFHTFYNKLRGREEEDTFPTTYPCNRKKDVAKTATAEGFDVVQIKVIEGRPEYLRLTAATYLCGLAYERFVNLSPMLEQFRIVMIFQLRKIGPRS